MKRSAGQPPSHDEVFRISGAPRALSDDVDGRTRRYLWSMAVRTLCFLLCVLFWVVLDQKVLASIFLVGAVLLPYVAVVIANAGRERRVEPPTAQIISDQPALPPVVGPDEPSR
jgi:Flp pilus assembly protein TadB